MWNFPVELSTDEEDGGFVVTFPDVPEAITQGENRTEALLYAQEALETALTMYIEEQRDLPSPSPAHGHTTVSPDALECAKLDIYITMRAQGVHKAELAQRLHWHIPQVDRLLDLGQTSLFEQIEQAAVSLGKRVELHIV
ncbi:MAG: type II toxin-antitoxin system HicB family antitoxin [Gammaproteobacteria bacterium]|nr:MAG: type II toxin-antitoxin system HicB family antitoxin [Gammaproteobacteria bacterium]RKZ39651.1 MAG: type II toxin-antitoxin system HicB family antitoxin [Gammaproteobacteria bacterium]RKZ73473.1 MAG: type II toxin-antitoxin system HicB family antitoxin [Gammaproteobacteria bacterium]